VNQRDKKEIEVTKQMIKYLKEGYGEPCIDYEEECLVCRAGQTVEFLEKHIGLMTY
jgi:hypothetical protein